MISEALGQQDNDSETYLDILGDVVLGSSLCAHLLERNSGRELDEGHLAGLAVHVEDTDCSAITSGQLPALAMLRNAEKGEEASRREDSRSVMI